MTRRVTTAETGLSCVDRHRIAIISSGVYMYMKGKGAHVYVHICRVYMYRKGKGVSISYTSTWFPGKFISSTKQGKVC